MTKRFLRPTRGRHETQPMSKINATLWPALGIVKGVGITRGRERIL